MTTQIRPRAEEVGRLGEALYQAGIRALVEPGNVGKFVSININHGHYVVGTDRMDSVDRLWEMDPNAVVYSVLIGYPAVASFGSGLKPNVGQELKRTKDM